MWHCLTSDTLAHTQDVLDSVLHDVAIALQVSLNPKGASPWAVPFQDAMLRQYITR